MPAVASNSISRRSLLRGRTTPEPLPFRPPWTDDPTVRERCTTCGDCINACPETVLAADGAGRPVVILDGRECTFCGACGSACAAGVFASVRTPPWPVVAEIGDGCLNALGIACQLCTDACPSEALRLDLSFRPVGRMSVDPEACTGCGACAGGCPVAAIELVDGRRGAAE